MPRRIGCVVLTLASVACGQAVRSGHAGPPEDLPCSEDALSAYIGEVAVYARSSDAVKLTVNTGGRSKGSAEISVKAGERLEDRFRINGRPFATEDYAKIELQPGTLRPGVRASIWFCHNQGPVLIDWSPNPGGGS